MKTEKEEKTDAGGRGRGGRGRARERGNSDDVGVGRNSREVRPVRRCAMRVLCIGKEGKNGGREEEKKGESIRERRGE